MKLGLGAVALALVGCCCGGGSAAPSDQTTHHLAANATVLDVVDGDTLVVDIDGTRELVRLIGIDTPESVAPERPVECYGREASAHIDTLLPPGTPIRLERDIEARDQYERLLAYVYRAEDGLDVNRHQVTQGYAAASSYPPNTALQADLTAAERQARAADTGLWGACGGPDVAIGPPPGEEQEDHADQ